MKFPSRYLLNWTTFTPIFIFLYSNLHIIYTTYLQRGTVSFRHISLFTLVILFIVGQSVQIVIFLIDLYNTNGFRSLLTPNLQKAMLQVLFGILFIQLIGLSVYGITINPLLGTLALVTTVNFYILIVFLTQRATKATQPKDNAIHFYSLIKQFNQPRTEDKSTI